MKATGLRGKTVIVTGASAGIGRATAKCFAAEGCNVAAWDVNESPRPMEEVKQAGGEAMFRKVNVCDAKDVDAAVAEVVATWGGVDVLINNAGITRDSQLVKWKDGSAAGTMTDDAFDAVVNVNGKGVFVCARAVVPHLIAKGGGVILNASSVVGLYGNFGQTNYAATKAGVIAFAKTWSRELAKYNIRVNAIAPGFIATEMVQKMPEKVLQSMVSHTPLG